ncbi:MAG: hypothetical protein ACXWZT_10595 [Gaiellaceae bacterium]
MSRGFRRRRPRNASRAAVAATPSAAGSRQLRPGDRAAVREISGCDSSNGCRAIRAAWLPGWSCPPWVATRGPCIRTFGATAAGATVAARERAGAPACFTSVMDGSTGVAALAGSTGAELASSAAAADSGARLATESTAGAASGAASGAGAGAAGSLEPAVSATAGAAASAADTGADATRGGSKDSGST